MLSTVRLSRVFKGFPWPKEGGASCHNRCFYVASWGVGLFWLWFQVFEFSSFWTDVFDE